jgi:hypothetical protein
MDKVDSQILGGGPPQRLIDPPICLGSGKALQLTSGTEQRPAEAAQWTPTELKAAEADGSPELPPIEIHILERSFILLRNIETWSGLAVLFAPPC